MSQKPNLKPWITSQLRRLSLRWPPRGRVLKAARKELPRKIKKDGTPYKRPNYEYQCAMCKDWFKSTKVVVDHIIPIVDPKNEKHKYLSTEEFIGKFAVGLFCYEDNLQVLCESCHDEKTEEEREIRKKS